MGLGMGVGSQTDGAIGTGPLHGQGTGTNVDPLLPFDPEAPPPFDPEPPLPFDPFGLLIGARQVHWPGETLLPLLPLLPEERDPWEEPEGTRQVHVEDPLDPDGTKPHPVEPFGPLPEGPLNDPLLPDGTTPDPFDPFPDGPLKDPLLPEGATPDPFEPFDPLPDGLLNNPLLPAGAPPFDLLPDKPLNDPLLPPEPDGDPFANAVPLGVAGTTMPGVVAPFHPSAVHPSLRH